MGARSSPLSVIAEESSSVIRSTPLTTYLAAARLRDLLNTINLCLYNYCLNKTAANKAALEAAQQPASKQLHLLSYRGSIVGDSLKEQISKSIANSESVRKEIDSNQRDIALFYLRKHTNDSAGPMSELSSSITNLLDQNLTQSTLGKSPILPNEVSYLTACLAKERAAQCQSELAKYSLNQSKPRQLALRTSIDKLKDARARLNALSGLSADRSKDISDLGKIIDEHIQAILSTKNSIEHPSETIRVARTDKQLNSIDALITRLEQQIK